MSFFLESKHFSLYWITKDFVAFIKKNFLVFAPFNIVIDWLIFEDE